MATLTEVGTVNGHRGSIVGSTFAGKYLLTSGTDRKIILHSMSRFSSEDNSAAVVHTFEGHHRYEMTDIAVADDHAIFACCGNDKVGFIWDVNSCTMTQKLLGHNERITSVGLNKLRSVAVTGSNDRTVKIFDLKGRGRDAIQTIRDFRDNVSCVRVGDTEIFASCVDGTMKTFDLRAGKMIEDALGPSIAYFSMSPDFKRALISCVNPGRLCLFDRGSGQVLTECMGHNNISIRIPCNFAKVKSAFNPLEETFLITGDESGKIIVYDLSGRAEHIISPYHGSVSTVSCSDHEYGLLFSASYDGTNRIFTLEGRDLNTRPV